ncbi:MAG TPA: thioredoxin fold domain-containing protein [Scandinavium sp.]|jgi:TrbB protein
MMTYSHTEGPFEAEIAGKLLSVRRNYQPLFTCRIKAQPWFVMRNDALYAQKFIDMPASLYQGEDAGQLLACLTGVLRKREGRISDCRLLGFGFVVAVLMITGGSIMLSVTNLPSPLSSLDGPPVQMPAKRLSHSTSGEPNVLPGPVSVAADESGRSLVATPTDGWSLSAEARAALPDKLHKASSRGLFTVPLSSGHTRTIYVFADPECANCQRMERHFETASGQVNVVIFPVTTEGGQDSLTALTPVMALSEAERASAWKSLFSADAGVSVPGAATAGSPEPEKAEIARGAIGVNEVAFRAYRLPGTPWTISDDGRYVPQAVLSSPAALKAFLEGGNHDGQ